LSMLDGKLSSLDNQELWRCMTGAAVPFLHIKKEKQTVKAFSSFQVHIQTQSKPLFPLYLFIFKKQFHVSLFFYPFTHQSVF
jgi:hypothetical protein